MSKRPFDKPLSTREPPSETRIRAETPDTASATREPVAETPLRADAVTVDTPQAAFPRIRATARPPKPAPARIGATPPLNDNTADAAAPCAPIRAEPVRQGVRRHSCESEKANGLTCDNPGRKSDQGIVRILTNLPEKIPVLPGEIALLETYWGAILDLMAANDNEAD